MNCIDYISDMPLALTKHDERAIKMEDSMSGIQDGMSSMLPSTVPVGVQGREKH